MSRLLMFCGLIIAFGQTTFAAPPSNSPVTGGVEGQRAFDDLSDAYARRKLSDADLELPDFAEAISNLDHQDENQRISAGKYLLALLRQSVADESNGRGGWDESPYSIVDRISVPKIFRTWLAEKLADQSAIEALDAAIWLVVHDPDPGNQALGAVALCRMQSPRSRAIFKWLLSQHQLCEAATISIVEEVAKRKLHELKPDLIRLANHYRTRVREEARLNARTLGAAPFPDFRSDIAFTPWLDERMNDISEMILTKIPKTSAWVRVEFAAKQEVELLPEEPREIYGWLLDKNEKTFRLYTWFGENEKFKVSEAKWKPADLNETARLLARRRAVAPPLTDEEKVAKQFGPNFSDLPTVLVAAWTYTRGDKQAAAEVLFPYIELATDDRLWFRTTRDLIGHHYHQSMLKKFSYYRDYDLTIAIARHLIKPVFEGYTYQERARELAAQLAGRRDDFREFRLPTEEEWTTLKTKLNREGQVKYLVSRMRLLTCSRQSPIGEVEYNEWQDSHPEADQEGRNTVINPYNELIEMHLAVSELPPLVPFLADDNFMPTLRYWRDDDDPDRQLPRAKWAVAKIVNEAAQWRLIEFDKINEQTVEELEVQVESAAAWIRENVSKTRSQLVSQALSSSQDWRDFESAAKEAVRLKLTSVHQIVVQRMPDFPQYQDQIAEICYVLNAPESTTDARTWIKSSDDKIRFWAALILLANSDKSKLEGLDVLADILSQDDGSELYPRAIEPLLATRAEPAIALAVGILRKDGFEDQRSYTAPVLHRLFLTGRQECLDYLLTNLSNNKPSHGTIGYWKGTQVTRQLLTGDGVAFDVMAWRNDGILYDALAPDEDRRAAREQIKTWLKEQFILVRKGRPHDLRAPSRIKISGDFLNVAEPEDWH
jgi:hypothetical protein